MMIMMGMKLSMMMTMVTITILMLTLGMMTMLTVIVLAAVGMLMAIKENMFLPNKVWKQTRLVFNLGIAMIVNKKRV